MLELQKEEILTISMNHIPEFDYDWLYRNRYEGDLGNSCLILDSYHFGWQFNLPNIKEEQDLEKIKNDLRNEGCSMAFCNCLQFAFDNGCSFLRLDFDGPEVKGLEVFEW